MFVEVVEDRAAREAGLLLDAGDRRAVVAVRRERVARAFEDLGAAGFEVLLG